MSATSSSVCLNKSYRYADITFIHHNVLHTHKIHCLHIFGGHMVEMNADWSLMCPNESPGLADVYGEEFEQLYEKYYIF